MHPKNQGRGVGGASLKSMIRELKKRGAKNIYLDAINGLENYYVKHGFSILRRSIALVISLENLPQRVIPLLNL